MADDERIDQFDRKILSLLQADGRLTNNDLSERVNLSPSQCSRRRQRLEEEGFIRGYRAVLGRGSSASLMAMALADGIAMLPPDAATIDQGMPLRFESFRCG